MLTLAAIKTTEGQQLFKLRFLMNCSFKVLVFLRLMEEIARLIVYMPF